MIGIEVCEVGPGIRKTPIPCAWMKSELVGMKGALLSGADMEAALWEEVRERSSYSVVGS